MPRFQRFGGYLPCLFPLCVCVVPPTKWVGKVQAQFIAENILYSAPQAGLLSVKRDLLPELRAAAGPLPAQARPAPAAPLRGCLQRWDPTCAHVQAAAGGSVPLCLLHLVVTTSPRRVQQAVVWISLFGVNSSENISKETTPVCTSAPALIGAFQSV